MNNLPNRTTLPHRRVVCSGKLGHVLCADAGIRKKMSSKLPLTRVSLIGVMSPSHGSAWQASPGASNTSQVAPAQARQKSSSPQGTSQPQVTSMRSPVANCHSPNARHCLVVYRLRWVVRGRVTSTLIRLGCISASNPVVRVAERIGAPQIAPLLKLRSFSWLS